VKSPEHGAVRRTGSGAFDRGAISWDRGRMSAPEPPVPPALPALPPLREVVARHDLLARKSLGQHFLYDPEPIERIVRAAGELAGVNVIEVGPGPGGLTRALVASAAAHVTAIEIDRRAVGAIGELAAARPGRLTLIEADALGLDLAALVPAPRAVVANLPYNVGTPLLIAWLRRAEDFRALTLMFQREVAERIVAPPGSEFYGRLAVLAQSLTTAEIVIRLPPGAFIPPPKVHSAVVRLVPRTDAPPAALRAALEKVTAAAFGQRRKMLRASLKPLGGETLLRAAGIDPERRAETLSLTEFATLAALVEADSA
jgi:16S rRNA (adenine1518-N6/adenine1519-N6)-dimethyltransferase